MGPWKKGRHWVSEGRTPKGTLPSREHQTRPSQSLQQPWKLGAFVHFSAV